MVGVKKMKCKFDNETLKLIALAVGTRNRYKENDKIEGHYLEYLVNKLLGNDGLSLDAENFNIYLEIKEIIKKIEGD